MKFQVGDKVVVNALGKVETGYDIGRKGTMTKVYEQLVNWPAFYVRWDAGGGEGAYYMKWFDLDVPLSPFEQRVRAYIARELPNG